MIPPLHFLMAYVLSSMLTRNTLLRRLAAIGGVIPDLDGIFLLFDMKAYYAYHHAIFHPLLGGALLSVVPAALFWLYEKGKGNVEIGLWKLFAFAFIGILIHDFGDFIGTSWPIAMLYPVPIEFSLSPAVSDYMIYGVINPAFSAIFVMAALAQPFLEGRSFVSVFSENLDRKLCVHLVPFQRRQSHKSQI